MKQALIVGVRENFSFQNLPKGEIELNKLLTDPIQAIDFVNKTNVLEKQLIGLGPSQVLNRGYSIAYMDSGEIIRSSVDIEIGDPFTLSTGKGSLGAEKTSDL